MPKTEGDISMNVVRRYRTVVALLLVINGWCVGALLRRTNAPPPAVPPATDLPTPATNQLTALPDGDPRVEPSKATAWVEKAFWEMRAIRPGMTRAALLKVFTTQGGIHNRYSRVYVYRGCRYFQVQVEFKPVGRNAGDPFDGVRERLEDVITNISQPYVDLPFYG